MQSAESEGQSALTCKNPIKQEAFSDRQRRSEKGKFLLLAGPFFLCLYRFVNREIWLFFLQKRKAFPLCARNKVLSRRREFAKISNGIITQSEYDYVEVRG